MNPVHHLILTTVAAVGAQRHLGRFPWRFWLGGAFADIDHLLWRTQKTGNPDPLATWRYFTSHPKDGPEGELLLHHNTVIATLLTAGRFHAGLGEFALGLAFHRLVDDLSDGWNMLRFWRHRQDRERLQALVFARENYTCQGCGASGVALELHHRLPESLGGTNHPDNLIALCRPCHDKAHRREERPQ